MSEAYPEGVWVCWGKGGYPYHMTYPTMHVMLPSHPPCGQNDGQMPVKTLPSRNYCLGR